MSTMAGTLGCTASRAEHSASLEPVPAGVSAVEAAAEVGTVASAGIAAGERATAG